MRSPGLEAYTSLELMIWAEDRIPVPSDDG